MMDWVIPPILPPSTLLASMASLNEGGQFSDVRLMCSDGAVLAPGLLMGAVSPALRNLNFSSYEDVWVVLPDFTVEEVNYFVQCLLSPVGPCEGEATQRFTTVLDFLGQISPEHYQQTMEEKVISNSPLETKMIKDEPVDCCEPELILEEEDVKVGNSTKTGVRMSKFGVATPKKGDKRFFTDKTVIEKLYDPELKKYPCPHCTKVFKVASNIAKHLAWHNANPLYMCPECEKGFKSYHTVKSHYYNSHKRTSRVYACTYENCNKAFKTSGVLKGHLKTHTDIKNFVCEDCGLRFRTKTCMGSHAERWHSAKKTPIACDECGKLVMHYNLTNHKLLHKEQRQRTLKCDQCNLTFRKESAWKRHMDCHDVSRPIACDLCSLRYKNKDQLRIHMETHDGKKYPCVNCSLVFSRPDNLKRHVKKKHGLTETFEVFQVSNQQT